MLRPNLLSIWLDTALFSCTGAELTPKPELCCLEQLDGWTCATAPSKKALLKAPRGMGGRRSAINLSCGPSSHLGKRTMWPCELVIKPPHRQCPWESIGHSKAWWGQRRRLRNTRLSRTAECPKEQRAGVGGAVRYCESVRLRGWGWMWAEDGPWYCVYREAPGAAVLRGLRAAGKMGGQCWKGENLGT